MKNIKGKVNKGKAKAKQSESGSDEETDHGKGEEDDDEEEEEEEEELVVNLVKDEFDRHPRRVPEKGKRNMYPCDECIRKQQACYAQDSWKARGACFDCGKARRKCIYSVCNYNNLQYSTTYYSIN